MVMAAIGPKAFIHLDRLRSNLWNIRRHIGERPLLCVVKANGYGHGAIPIAKAISREPGVNFAVFSLDEALELRKNSINNNILVFSKMQPEYIELAILNNLILNLSSLDDMEHLNSYFSRYGKCPRFHIKFDTGMTRLGVNISDAEPLLDKIASAEGIYPEGIYSHFSTADEGDISYAEYQLSQFNSVLEMAKKYNIHFKYVHCSNSGSILNLPQSYFNMVRVGMLIYGVAPSKDVSMDIVVEPVMSFCGSIVELRRVPEGTQVSYGGIYSTNKETTIGVVQTGFADGFPRPWFQNGFVSYNGQGYKIAGRVCMDQLMVDFGDETPIIGDDVLFFGKKDLDHLPVESIAESIGSTTYVLLTAIKGRTKYILLKD